VYSFGGCTLGEATPSRQSRLQYGAGSYDLNNITTIMDYIRLLAAIEKDTISCSSTMMIRQC